MTAPRFMTAEEHAATVAAILARRSEDDEYRAAAVATAIAHRIDERVRKIDAWLAREDRKVVSFADWKARRRVA